MPHQPLVLAPVPHVARSLLLRRRLSASPEQALAALTELTDVLVGIGPGLVAAAGRTVEGLRRHPAWTGPGGAPPATPFDAWVRIPGADRGAVVHTARRVRLLLDATFAVAHAVDEFQHGDSRDLTGYEDGTENPVGDDAAEAGVVAEGPLAGSAFAAVQLWEHDLSVFAAMGRTEQDHTIGRRRSDNEELDDAPASAHVKRTAQEDFEPQAFVVRRSMPWADGDRAGLLFVAFGRSFDAYEAQLHRMLGLDDGVADALFRFTRPVTGSFFWCPPIADGRLDLSGMSTAG